jgi:hypothetical protein
MKRFSKRAIWTQIIYGILFSFVANPYLIYNHVIHSKLFVVFQIIFFGLLFLNAVVRYCKEDVSKAIDLGYLRYNKNFFTIFLFTVFEILFLSYLWAKYFLKVDVNPYIFILLPTGIAFLLALLISYLIKKRRISGV